jgi:hypothetical protein
MIGTGGEGRSVIDNFGVYALTVDAVCEGCAAVVPALDHLRRDETLYQSPDPARARTQSSQT